MVDEGKGACAIGSEHAVGGARGGGGGGDDARREATRTPRLSELPPEGMAARLREWREAYARGHGGGPPGLSEARAWWAAGIATTTGVLHWSPGYVTPDGALTGAVGALVPAQQKRVHDAGRRTPFAYYTVGYWEPEQPRAAARAREAGVPGVADGGRGWSAARVVPGGAGAGDTAVERAPYLYATLAEAQAAAERFHACGGAAASDPWPAPATGPWPATGRGETP